MKNVFFFWKKKKKFQNGKKFQKHIFSWKKNLRNKVPNKILFSNKHFQVNFFYKQYITKKLHKIFSKK